MTQRPPKTAKEWERVHEIKLEVFQRDPMTLRAEDFPEIRSEILMSWKRSLLAGVDPYSTEIPFDENFSPSNRLSRVAQPIMQRLEDQLSDLSSWGFLTDRGCRLLTSVVGDDPVVQASRRTRLRPGLCFSEDAIGTNGISMANEAQKSQIVSGTEHFRIDSGILTTTGVNIRDPYTRRYVGTLGVHCRREYSSGAILPLVTEIGHSIEAQLLASRADGEKVFFDHFLRLQRRSRGAVVGITRDLFLLNSQSRQLVHESDEGILRRLAEEAAAKSKILSVQRRMSSGVTTQIKIEPVEQARGEFAAVLVLEAVAVPNSYRVSEMNRIQKDFVRPGFRSQLDRALQSKSPVLLIGERGTGKRQLVLDSIGEKHKIRVIECSGAVEDPASWLENLQKVADLAEERILLNRVDELPTAMASTVSDCMERSTIPFIGTALEGFSNQGAAVVLHEGFEVLITVPPLRDRADEFSEICKRILDEFEANDGRKASLPPKTLAHLVANDWPGNLRQLRQVLATSRTRAVGTAIQVTDLPPRYSRVSRQLGEMETIERKTLMVALREADGNRNLVAERLGISRATVYRKLKRYELH